MAAHEGEGLGELAGAARGVHAEPGAEAGADEPGAQDEVGGGDGRGHQVVGAHHLGAGVGLEGAEDVVLGAVGEAVEQEVDAEEEQAPGRVARLFRILSHVLFTAAAAAGFPRVQREDRDAGRDGRDDQVLVEGVAAAEDGDVQQHDGQQLAALGQQEGDVVEVGEGGVAEGAGEGAGQRDEQERRQDAARRDHRGDRDPPRRAPPQVHRPRQRRERRLDRVQEHRVLEALRALAWQGAAVRGRRELLLEVGPCETIYISTRRCVYVLVHRSSFR